MPSSPAPPQTTNTYVGRFAPSPSGPLHFGSLVTALASYLDAKAHHGQWLVRIEDIDPPREQPGATDAILRCLEGHGLLWDGPLMYQHQRHNAYRECIVTLTAHNRVYPCNCSRQDLASMGGIYNGHCRHRLVDTTQPHALRLKLYGLEGCPSDDEIHFNDLIQGPQVQNLRTQAGDQILKRRDGLYAYQLAVVVDDIAQGITHVIRGADLLDVTGRQLFLFGLLGAPLPEVGHIPLALRGNGQKLSKQNHARAIDTKEASRNLWRGLEFLGQNPPANLAAASTGDILDWGLHNWCRDKIKGLGHVYIDDEPGPQQ